MAAPGVFPFFRMGINVVWRNHPVFGKGFKNLLPKDSHPYVADRINQPQRRPGRSPDRKPGIIKFLSCLWIEEGNNLPFIHAAEDNPFFDGNHHLTGVNTLGAEHKRLIGPHVEDSKRSQFLADSFSIKIHWTLLVFVTHALHGFKELTDLLLNPLPVPACLTDGTEQQIHINEDLIIPNFKPLLTHSSPFYSIPAIR